MASLPLLPEFDVASWSEKAPLPWFEFLLNEQQLMRHLEQLKTGMLLLSRCVD